jgi:hypothetical protein
MLIFILYIVFIPNKYISRSYHKWLQKEMLGVKLEKNLRWLGGAMEIKVGLDEIYILIDRYRKSIQKNIMIMKDKTN